MPSDVVADSQTTLEIACVGRVNFASAQNAVPIIKSAWITNPSDEPWERLTLHLMPHPAFCRSKTWTIDRIGPQNSVSIADRDLTLDLAFLSGLNEAERGHLTFRLEREGVALFETFVPIELLARDEWGGLGDMAHILGAFVSPNEGAVSRILKEASRLLEAGGHRPALDGYQSADPARAYMLTAAIWSAVTGLGLSYAVPPRSFERAGQKVRSPAQIETEGLATCLDTALLFAAALEAAGLNPAIIFTQGHAFAGVWLTNRTFTAIVEPDVTELRKAITAREFVAFETTLVTSRPPAGFDHAVANGRAQLSEERETEFEQAVDIARARAAGIRPLASHRVESSEPLEATAVAPAALPAMPDFGLLPDEIGDETPATPKGRIERWQRKLLDLSLRNRLLNFSDTKQTVPFVCPDVPKLEDLLAEGASMRIVSLDDENPVGERDPALYRQQTGQDIHAAFAASALERKQVCVPLPGRDMTARLTTLYRRAKSDLAEGGTNTLFLAAGFLRWKKTPDDKRTYRAPLLLLPVKLNRRSAQSDFFLTHHEDDVRFNATLLQFLERDFGLRIPSLAGDLPVDHAGLDLPRIFETMRLAVRDVPGFEVVEDLALSTFSFAKYLMWKDLVDRTDSLRNNRLVRHLIDSPETPFAGAGEGLPEPREIDRRHAPADLLTPLPADSSQLAAVVAAAEGRDFVVIGPPGTGKSQTIANMIAHCLAKGKSVLFVAEKSAALDVVYRRLKAYGLGDACLELHSNKADRRSVIGQLGAAWDRATRASQQEWIKVTSDLRVHRNQLNAYVDALHAPGSHGFSVFEAIGEVVGKAAPFELGFASSRAHDEETFASLASLAEQAGRTFEVVRECRSLGSINREEFSLAWQSELLSKAGRLAEAARHLISNSGELERALGMQPDPDVHEERLAVLSRFASIVGKTAAGDYRAAIDADFDRYLGGLDELEAEIGSVRKARARLTASYSDGEVLRMPLEDLDRDWREATAKIWPLSALAMRRVRKLLQSYAEAGRAEPDTEISVLRAIRAGLRSISDSALSALPPFDGVETDIERMKAFLSDAEALRTAITGLDQHAADPRAMTAAIAAILPARAEQQPIAEAARAFLTARQEFDDALNAYATHAGGKPLAGSLGGVLGEMKGVEQERARIADWTRWADLRSKAIARGLEPLISAIEEGKVDDAEEAFRVSYFSWWLPLALDERDELRGFLHWEHADRIANFRRLDAVAQTLAAEQVRRAVAHGLPARDGVPRNSELGILRHQLGLQRPSVSIRALIGQMPQTFTKLAPCVLMSPLSVAQYLPPDHSQFDMVIFDEASQITTWDAVGAIARGQQSIIVGDPKQLPPTNFFGRTEEDDEDLVIYEKDLPSILDEAAAAGLPTLQLNWHYRSRDEALIAFSNHHYYGDRLVTFPSPKTETDALRFHRVDGVYARGAGRTNEVEAKAIVALAVKRLKDWLALEPDERPSLGVITFNAQQQELILDLLDAARREVPELEWFFDDEREEPVIVKNLENIQGDERDVMLFSVTFGPDKAGKIAMNFGAVNAEGGEKRLNVAITRSRSELHIFASITADQIDLSRTKARGVAHLKNFLAYAERGAVALPGKDEGSLGPAESQFEEAVAQRLVARGWEVRTQIGVSGFRIDLGVVHPDWAGSYLAGIECDGATYHRSASARDRDQIREGVLRNLGWEVLRVWSTDWFMNPDEALDRLDSCLHDLLASSRAAQAEAEAAALEAASDGDREADDIATAPVESDGGNDAESVANEEAPQRPDDLEGVGVQANALTNAVEDADRRVEYARGDEAATREREGASQPPPTPDADQFFERRYTATLEAIISDIVIREGPIRHDLLVRSVARAHGWQRAGRRIRERVDECLGENEVMPEGEAVFVWPKGTYALSIPFRNNLDRSAREVSRSEIQGLIDANPDLGDSLDPALDLARLMGIARLSEDARDYLTNCLAAAGIISPT